MAGPGAGPRSGAGLDDDAPLSPRDALAVLEAQQDRVSRSLEVDVPVILGAWGVTWLVGFGLAYLASAAHPVVSWWLARPVIGVLNVAAMIVSFGLPAGERPGDRGPVVAGHVDVHVGVDAGLGGVTAVNAGLQSTRGCPGGWRRCCGPPARPSRSACCSSAPVPVPGPDPLRPGRVDPGDRRGQRVRGLPG